MSLVANGQALLHFDAARTVRKERFKSMTIIGSVLLLLFFMVMWGSLQMRSLDRSKRRG
jgi:hypothetical protein